VTLGKRNRAFEAPKAVEAFTELERALVTPLPDPDQELPASDY
jgi:hypothetical protein